MPIGNFLEMKRSKENDHKGSHLRNTSVETDILIFKTYDQQVMMNKLQCYLK